MFSIGPRHCLTLFANAGFKSLLSIMIYLSFAFLAVNISGDVYTDCSTVNLVPSDVLWIDCQVRGLVGMIL